METGRTRKTKTIEPTRPRLYITELACGDCAMRCSSLGRCKQSLSASGGSAMCLDAAVMGTCPTFINQSWKKKKGNSVKGAKEREEGRGDAE